MTQPNTLPAPPGDQPSSPRPNSPLLQPSDPPKFPSNPNSAFPPGPPASPNTTPNMRVHPSVLRYALPLSKFSRLPVNAGKEIWVGLIIVGKDGTGATALLVRPSPQTASSNPSVADFSADPPTIGSLQTRLQVDDHAGKENRTLPPFEEAWDLPSIRTVLGVDQTLLEAVDRCAREMTGRGVREISRFLQSRDFPTGGSCVSAEVGNGGLREVSGDISGRSDDTGRAGAVVGVHGESGTIRRCDFLVKLHPGPTVLPEGWEGKWVGTDESWRVMKRIPKGANALT